MVGSSMNGEWRSIWRQRTRVGHGEGTVDHPVAEGVQEARVLRLFPKDL